jgi:hypothetical protein
VINSFRKLQTEEWHIHIKFRFTFDKIAIGTLEILKLPFRENILRTELCDIGFQIQMCSDMSRILNVWDIVCHQNVQETNTETNHEAAISVEIFCDVCWEVCGENFLRSGTQEIDFSTRLMPLLIALSLQEFQANNGMTVAPHPPSYI